jgi:hypothetical protein
MFALLCVTVVHSKRAYPRELKVSIQPHACCNVFAQIEYHSRHFFKTVNMFILRVCVGWEKLSVYPWVGSGKYNNV